MKFKKLVDVITFLKELYPVIDNDDNSIQGDLINSIEISILQLKMDFKITQIDFLKLHNHLLEQEIINVTKQNEQFKKLLQKITLVIIPVFVMH